MPSTGVYMVPMGKDIYDQIDTAPNIDGAWKLIRERIGYLMFGEAYTTVPFLTSADYFNEYFVFTKKRTFMDAVMRRRPIYNIIGNAEFMIDRDLSTWFPQFDFSGWDENDALTMHREYRFRLTSAPNVDMPKLIEVVFRKPKVRAVNFPVQENIVLHSMLEDDLRNIQYVYVITEVVLATYAHLLLRIGCQQTVVQYDRDIPIAFRYRKFKIKKNGIIVREVSTKMKYSDREVEWLRPIEQALPRPQYCNREKLERKNRTALTVSRREGINYYNNNPFNGGNRNIGNGLDFYPNALRPLRRGGLDESTRQQILRNLQRQLVNYEVSRVHFRNHNSPIDNDDEHVANGRSDERSI